MARKEPVFDLIASLTKAEKRRFRLQAERYASKRGHHDYMALFDRLAGMRVYDATALEDDFGGPASLASTKRYLLEVLVNALLAFRTPNRVVERIELLLRQAQLFEDKRIYYRSVQLYERALTLSKEQHRFGYMLETANRLRRLFGRWKEGGEKEEAVAALMDDMERYSELQMEFTRLQKLHFRLHAEIVRWKKSGKGMGPEVESALAADWFVAAEYSVSNLNRMHHAVITAEYHSVMSRPAESLVAMENAAHLAQLEPVWQLENPSVYAALLNNLLGRLVVLERWEEAKPLLEALASFQTREQIADDRRFESWALNSLIVAVHEGLYPASADIQAIKEGLGRPGMNPAFALAIRLELAILEASHDRLREAWSWLQEFFADARHPKLRQHTMFANLLHLLILAREGASDVVEREAANYQRRKADEGYALDFERITVAHLLRWARTPKAEQVAVLERLDQKLEPLRNSDRFQIYLDVQAWCRALLGNQTVAEVVQGRLLESD